MNKLIHSDKIVYDIYQIRNTKVMLDFNLAQLYGVETRSLKQQVKRNIERFPEDFMFQLSKEDWMELITKCDKLKNIKYSPVTPLAFTEQGIAMLSSVLRSERAIKVNIAIMRTFVHTRKVLESNRGLAKSIENLEKKYDQQFKVVFTAIKSLIGSKPVTDRKIGFRIGKK